MQHEGQLDYHTQTSEWFLQISIQTSSHVAIAIVWYSTFALDWVTTLHFLLFVKTQCPHVEHLSEYDPSQLSFVYLMILSWSRSLNSGSLLEADFIYQRKQTVASQWLTQEEF